MGINGADNTIIIAEETIEVEQVDPQKLRGTLIAAPIVNVFGVIEQSRYLD